MHHSWEFPLENTLERHRLQDIVLSGPGAGEHPSETDAILKNAKNLKNAIEERDLTDKPPISLCDSHCAHNSQWYHLA